MYGELSSPSYCTGYQSNALFRSKTGSIALRLAEVQPPNTAATLSWEISFCAFSANVGQSEAPSSTTGSSFLPSTPPAALTSSMASSSAFLTVTSLIAIVPLNECRIPTLMVSPLLAEVLPGSFRHAVASASGSTRARAETVRRNLSATRPPTVWTAGPPTGSVDTGPTTGMAGLPGFCPAVERRASHRLRLSDQPRYHLRSDRGGTLDAPHRGSESPQSQRRSCFRQSPLFVSFPLRLPHRDLTSSITWTSHDMFQKIQA